MSLKRITIPILKKNKDANASKSILRLETNSTTRTDDIFMTSSYQNELNNEEQVHMATPPKLRKRSSSFWEEMIRQKKEKRQKEDSSKDNDKPLKDGVLQVQDILDKRFSDNNKSSVGKTYLPISSHSRDTKRDTNKDLVRYRDTRLSNKRGSCESYDSIMSCYHGKQLKSSTTNKKKESVLGMITFPCQEAEEEVRPTQEVREGQKSSSSTMSRRRGSMLTSLIDAL